MRLYFHPLSVVGYSVGRDRTRVWQTSGGSQHYHLRRPEPTIRLHIRWQKSPSLGMVSVCTHLLKSMNLTFVNWWLSVNLIFNYIMLWNPSFADWSFSEGQGSNPTGSSKRSLLWLILHHVLTLVQLSFTAGSCKEAVSCLCSKEARTSETSDAG